MPQHHSTMHTNIWTLLHYQFSYKFLAFVSIPTAMFWLSKSTANCSTFYAIAVKCKRHTEKARKKNVFNIINLKNCFVSENEEKQKFVLLCCFCLCQMICQPASQLFVVPVQFAPYYSQETGICCCGPANRRRQKCMYPIFTHKNGWKTEETESFARLPWKSYTKKNSWNCGNVK